MKPADYKCEECGRLRTIFVKDDEAFPKHIQCSHCDGEAIRKFTPLFPICHQGKCGNAKNSYTSNPVKIKKT